MEEQRIPTTERLASALEQAKAPQEMIDRARAGYYDDFKSKLAIPQARLLYDAARYRLTDIAKRAMEGEFDNPKWESDEKSADGRATFAEFRHLFPKPVRERKRARKEKM